jgi:hypothetical protein
MYYIIAASGKKATTNAHNAASADWTASKKMWGDPETRNTRPTVSNPIM